MAKEVDIRVTPELVKDQEAWKQSIAKKLQIDEGLIHSLQLLKRSIDARGRSPKFQLRVRVFLEGDNTSVNTIATGPYILPKEADKVVIVGAGPCGYFAALRCIEIGLSPIVLDRGKDVRARRRDLRQIQQFHTVHPDSNYCFGEGGAGTYSDGKLYTRSVKRGNVKKMLQILVDHGASEDILVDAHPHIGSNKLPQIVANIRTTIEKAGGQVLFDTKVVDFIIEKNRMVGAIDQNGQEHRGSAVVLCTGHSARDIYQLCYEKDIDIEFKPFAIGMRIEHPQSLIDQIQYNRSKGAHLPAASYSLSCQVEDRGVFSFCMCPGGLIVPAATSPGEIVVNGMSLSRRDSPFANAAAVVTIDDNPERGNPFGGMNYQQALEQKIFNAGDGSQQAPAQRVTDFIRGRISQSLPDSSYIPGTYAAPMHELLPQSIVNRLRKAIKIFDQKMRGYLTAEAQFVGLESRTSAPIRIPRDKTTYMHPKMMGLFPAGEGAGYAGGILSATLDGDKIADAVKAYVRQD